MFGLHNVRHGHMVGFVAGVGASALGFYLYKKNQNQIEDFLRSQGVSVPQSCNKMDLKKMTMEEMVREKEKMEDLIAEREQQKKKGDSGKSK